MNEQRSEQAVVDVGDSAQSQQSIEQVFRDAGYSGCTAVNYGGRVVRWKESGLKSAEFVTAANGRSEYNMRLAALKAWAKLNGEELEVPTKWRRVNPPAHQTPTVSQTMSWLSAVRDRYTTREFAAAMLLYASGLRISELLGARLSDLNLNARELKVYGKGGKERAVVFAQAAVTALRHYINTQRRQQVTDDSPDLIFLGDHGGPFSQEALRNALRRSCRLAGIPKPRWIAHGLRHACFTHLRQGGMNLRYIQRLAGHSSLDTTAQYLQLTPQELRDEMQKLIEQ